MSIPITGSLLTAAIVLVLTIVFWGLWALHIGSFTKVPKEPGPRVIIIGGLLVSLSFTFMLMDTAAGKWVIPTLLVLAAVGTWLVSGISKGHFWAWTDSVITRSVVISGLVLTLLMVILVLVLPDAQTSAGKVAAKCCEYCEARHLCRELATQTWADWRKQAPSNLQPSNAWSNMVFILVGCLAVAARPKEPLAWAFGLSSTALAIGSFLFHASLTSGLFQSMDVAGIYGVLFATVMYGLERLMSPTRAYWRTGIRWLVFGVILTMAVLFLLFKSTLDQLGAMPIMGIFFGVILLISFAHLYLTYNMTSMLWAENIQVVDHPATHEAVTMFLPLFLLGAAITVRQQDMFVGGFEKLGGDASLCPIATDYGHPVLGLIPIISLFVILVIMALLVNFFAKRRSGLTTEGPRSGRPGTADWFVPSCAVIIYLVLVLLLILLPAFQYSSCQEAGWFNGHTWWHILVASALYLQWRYYDHHKENITGKPVL